MSHNDQKADVYAAGERAWMVRTQQLRARLFAPLLRLLAACRVTPDHLTILSLLFGLAFCPLYATYPVWALIALALHVAIDGLDGPLARHLGTDSRKGSFTDSMADQTVIAASTITLMLLDVVAMLPGVLYIVTYTVVVLFAMARNAMNDPYSWLFRPRFYVYGWIIAERWWWPGSLDYLLWACAVILALKVITGFFGVRRNM